MLDKTLSRLLASSVLKARSSPPESAVVRIKTTRAAAEWYATQVRWATGKLDEIEAENGASHSCAKGCHFCCYQAIPMAAFEAAAIDGYMRSAVSGNRRTVIQKSVLTTRETIEHSLGEPSYDPGREDELAILRRIYFKKHIACPLLAEDGSCSVYPVRPISCWTYRAYSSPKWCSKSPDVAGTLTFRDWEEQVVERARRAFSSAPSGWRSARLRLLPFALGDFCGR